MKISCKKQALYEAVQKVEKIVTTRSSLPIIGNLLFEAQKGEVKISANNLEMGMEITIPVKVEKEGSVLIPAKTIGGVVSKLPNIEINIETNENNLIKIFYKNSNFNIHGLSPEEFPLLPKLKEIKSLSLKGEIISQIIKETIFAVSQSEDKHVLNGVLIEFGKGIIRFVATDGYRLARYGEKVSSLPAGISNVIIPAKALLEVGRIIQSAGSEPLEIMFAADQVAFRHKNSYLVSRIIQGQFPDYNRVIPKSSDTQIVISTEEFLESAERTAIIAASSANIIKVEIKGEKMHLVANAPDVGSVDEILDVEFKNKSKKDKTQIAFNVKLMVDVLKVIESEKVILELSGALSPGIIKPADGSDYIYIIMPIRTTDVQ